MNRAFHTFAIVPLAAAPPDLPVQAGPPVLRPTRISRVDPVGKAWGDLDPTQKSMLAVHGAILLAVSYHGYKRHGGSIPWGLIWSLGGLLCPTVTMGFALTQGYAKPLSKGA